MDYAQPYKGVSSLTWMDERYAQQGVQQIPLIVTLGSKSYLVE